MAPVFFDGVLFFVEVDSNSIERLKMTVDPRKWYDSDLSDMKQLGNSFGT